MHTYVPILVEDVDDYTIPDELDLYDILKEKYGADYLTVREDTDHPEWLKNLRNADGTYSLKREEVEKARIKLLDEAQKAIDAYKKGEEDWGWTAYKLRKHTDFEVPTICVIFAGDSFQIDMYSDFEPSDIELTLVGYIDYHF